MLQIVGGSVIRSEIFQLPALCYRNATWQPFRTLIASSYLQVPLIKLW